MAIILFLFTTEKTVASGRNWNYQLLRFYLSYLNFSIRIDSSLKFKIVMKKIVNL